MPMFTYDPPYLADILVRARKRLNLTQEQAADEIGISRTTLSAIETGKRLLQAEEFIDMASILHYDIGLLLKAAEPEATIDRIDCLLREHTPIPTTGVEAIMSLIRLLMEQSHH